MLGLVRPGIVVSNQFLTCQVLCSSTFAFCPPVSLINFCSCSFVTRTRSDADRWRFRPNKNAMAHPSAQRGVVDLCATRSNNRRSCRSQNESQIFNRRSAGTMESPCDRRWNRSTCEGGADALAHPGISIAKGN